MKVFVGDDNAATHKNMPASQTCSKHRMIAAEAHVLYDATATCMLPKLRHKKPVKGGEPVGIEE